MGFAMTIGMSGNATAGGRAEHPFSLKEKEAQSLACLHRLPRAVVTKRRTLGATDTWT